MSPAAASSMSPPTHYRDFSPHPHRRTSPSSLCLQSSSTYRRNALWQFFLNFISFLMFLPNMEFITISRRQVLLCTPHFRRLSPEKLQEAKQTFLHMEEMGLCQKASSPWASPLHLVKKDNGTWRSCGDCRHFNMLTEADPYPLPNMADVTCNLHDARIFSKLDLLKGYYQFPVYPEDIPKTVIHRQTNTSHSPTKTGKKNKSSPQNTDKQTPHTLLQK